ncbi:hypothetical protein ACP4OV_025545 [Aristida adscensionis]
MASAKNKNRKPGRSGGHKAKRKTKAAKAGNQKKMKALGQRKKIAKAPPPPPQKTKAPDGKGEKQLRQSAVQRPDDRSRTGRLGEATVHEYFADRLGCKKVNWVNKDREAGLPYDIVITNGDEIEYVEVKATANTSSKKKANGSLRRRKGTPTALPMWCYCWVSTRQESAC